MFIFYYSSSLFLIFLFQYRSMCIKVNSYCPNEAVIEKSVCMCVYRWIIYDFFFVFFCFLFLQNFFNAFNIRLRIFVNALYHIVCTCVYLAVWLYAFTIFIGWCKYRSYVQLNYQLSFQLLLRVNAALVVVVTVAVYQWEREREKKKERKNQKDYNNYNNNNSKCMYVHT